MEQDNDNSNNIEENSILYVSFNQDASFFSIGTQTGYAIYITSTLKKKVSQDLNGGIGIIEMLNKTNIIGLVGGGKNPKYPLNKLIIYDIHQLEVISELKFISNVLNVKFKNDKIFATCEKKIYLFHIKHFEIFENYETADNPKGIMSIALEDNIIAFPKKETEGSILIKNYENKKEITIECSKEKINFISLNRDGTILATTNIKGTIIKIYNTITGDFIKEVRRGKENAEIYSISFDKKSNFICVTSDRKTVHIFNIEKEINNDENDNLPKNHKSIFGKVSGFFGIDYFNSEWSFKYIKTDDEKSICRFSLDDTIYVLSYKGNFYNADYKENIENKHCKIINKLNILNV